MRALDTWERVLIALIVLVYLGFGLGIASAAATARGQQRRHRRGPDAEQQSAAGQPVEGGKRVVRGVFHAKSCGSAKLCFGGAA